MEYDWIIFGSEYSSDFHPTFEKELNRQLFEKGSSGTGIKQFAKYNFQLVVGVSDTQLKLIGDKVFAQIEFITPTSWSFPIEIYWTAENSQNLLEIHKEDISKRQLVINWADNFPIQKILPHIRPYRIDKKVKTNFNFDVEYYYYLLPDICLEFSFSRKLNKEEIKTLDTFLVDFKSNWNEKNKGKEVEFISNVKELENNVYQVIADIGLKNSIKTINELLKSYSTNFEHLTTLKITIN